MGNVETSNVEREEGSSSDLRTAVARPSVDIYPDTPLEQAKKDIDAELNQNESLEDLDFAGTILIRTFIRSFFLSTTSSSHSSRAEILNQEI